MIRSDMFIVSGPNVMLNAGVSKKQNLGAFNPLDSRAENNINPWASQHLL